MQPISYSSALQRAQSLCARGEQCAADIRRKVLGWGLSEAEADKLVDELTADRFLDPVRYVHAFVHDRYLYQHWGRQKIRFALRQKGLDAALIDTALDDVTDREDYVATCVSQLRQKMRSTTDRARLFRFAAQRGFEVDIIHQALDILKASDGVEDESF